MGCLVNVVDGSRGFFPGFSPESVRAWARLATALQGAGPVPCEYEPEAWWAAPGLAQAEDAVYGCSRCPVTALCLAYAVAADERYGIWGGENMASRRRSTGSAA